jgi:hypothetical protein
MRFHLAEETWGRGWCVGWVAEGEEWFLGQQCSDVSKKVAGEIAPAGRSKEGVYYWVTKAQAARAMRLARVHIRENEQQRLWPTWAKKAIAEGWKPPRRWKPPVGVVDGD